jgi:hypothetical protein
VAALTERLARAQPVPAVDGKALCERFDWNLIAADTLAAYRRVVQGTPDPAALPSDGDQ